MKRRAIHRERTIWRRLLKGIVFVFVLTGAGLALYSWHLSTQIEKRFSGRRWSIPSKVYSDTTILYPGQNINRSLLSQQLDRLGYTKVDHSPSQSGELRISQSRIELFLHDLEIPSHERKGFPVRIDFSRARIESITRTDKMEPVPLLELEPEEIMLFFGRERQKRQLITIDQVPRHLIDAVLAAEDNRFFRHRGMDVRGILRAFYTNLRHGNILHGGSTITQQLAKNYFLTPERTLSRKFKELLLSLTAEALYEKKEILEIYLNEIYLGQKGSVSINGIGEASYFYFGKPVSDLSLSESASLAGLIRGPNHYSPYVDKDRCKRRRDAVLRTMFRNGWIHRDELESALESQVETAGYKAYGKKAPYFTDYLSEQLSALYPPEALSSLGLSIYTTLDVEVQIAAEKALASGLARLEKLNPALDRPRPDARLQGAVVVMQPQTGYILAMVGGRDYSESQFNRVTQARRQPGSAFKPFVFLSGLDQFTPASIFSNAPISYERDGHVWKPENYEPMPEEYVRMRQALARSVNRATVDLSMQVGIDRIIETARRFGFSTPFQPFPSLALGASEVVPLELARAYCAFAADGVLPYPLSLKAVFDERGEILERRHMTIERVTSPEKAYIMNSMLRSVITEGTGRSLTRMGISFPVCGKTGTTNSFRDAWFVGYTPDILALVWVGFDNGDPVQTSGSAAALPVWAEFIKSIPQQVSGGWFKTPPGIVKLKICAESGQLATHGCPETVEEVFLSDNAPSEACALHQMANPVEQIIKGVRDLFKKF